MAGAWLVEWTETERGWGMRPDGAYYYPSKKAAEKDTAKREQAMRDEEEKQGFRQFNAPDVYSFPEQVRFVHISDKLATEIAEKGVVFLPRPEEIYARLHPDAGYGIPSDTAE
jgi:hypothetical protein